MRIGVVGLGKLGMPVALAMSLKGHDVMGYDIDPGKMQKDLWPYMEQGPNGEPSMEPFLQESDLRFGSLQDVVRHAEIIFVVVQTPHAPKYEGITRLPTRRKDFDYSYLKSAISDINTETAALQRSGYQYYEPVVAIISTVLPGTIRREILPLAKNLHICHTPFFEAMGTVVRDFFDREFALCGTDDEWAAKKMRRFYDQTTDAPQVFTSLESAEAIKVFYNTFASLKVVFANTIMEVCHKTPGADVDEVTNALKMATQRLISPMYLSGGMGDGGSCHPRDNIALSWLARDKDLSFDLFGAVMTAREKQAEWLAGLMCEYDLPKVILGKSFKAGSNITTGSACLLVANILEEWGESVTMYDPLVDGRLPLGWVEPGVFLVGMNHERFKDLEFAPGSVVLDVWRMMPKQPDNVTLIPIGGAA